MDPSLSIFIVGASAAADAFTFQNQFASPIAEPFAARRNLSPCQTQPRYSEIVARRNEPQVPLPARHSRLRYYISQPRRVHNRALPSAWREIRNMQVRAAPAMSSN